MKDNETIQGYQIIMQGVMNKFSESFGIGSKPIYDYVEPVFENGCIIGVRIIDKDLQQYLIDEIKLIYPIS
ncbi:hypothetical protein [Mucilaginibacter flavidus]|uniref:hypothetical protein n=1 Tax=Mucilaginibacter flavidus TaxID=2949309 RepID=UPI00209264AD|nr:hypothetical protein [Mucilaginibacter flavidus]MCO5945707.1 hypothetical protein [Mucilaginibacter flavidus]